ncbi:neuronal PAS domain-containing protein 1-like isoform X2 [Paramacrobiotus metropolitanus]|uniref:neuronal PAS domain-containing protein 1-like isoform X2 n=1 Tax=Paramacrobiotus metropolitanus TaxID=2943436 RepID=UPI0024462BD9|nr:neuronal PAS domain-containing protein 1-like isoform X2 [Paramacrobiotus metropolitanus]
MDTTEQSSEVNGYYGGTNDQPTVLYCISDYDNGQSYYSAGTLKPGTSCESVVSTDSSTVQTLDKPVSLDMAFPEYVATPSYPFETTPVSVIVRPVYTPYVNQDMSVFFNGMPLPPAYDAQMLTASAPLDYANGQDGHVTPCNFGVTEMRKEKSRDAARNRRGRENTEFLCLAKLLPLPSAITSQLDKASVIRLCISSLKLRSFCANGDPPWMRDPPKKHNLHQESTEFPRLSGPIPSGLNAVLQPFAVDADTELSAAELTAEAADANFGSYVLQAHDGFIMAVAEDGQLLYISETVSVYLGLSQVELTGNSIFEYIHPDDRSDLAVAMGIPFDPIHFGQEHDIDAKPEYDSPPVTKKGHEVATYSNGNSSTERERKPRSPRKPDALPTKKMMSPTNLGCGRCTRFRSTLTKRGVQMKYSGYRVLAVQWWPRSWNAEMLQRQGGAGVEKFPDLLQGYVMCASALPSLNMNEMRVDRSCFTMRLGLNFKILSVDSRVEELARKPTDGLIGQSFYELCFASDIQISADLHRDVVRKGQALSGYYRVRLDCSRIAGADAVYYWIQTGAHLMANNKSPNDHSIVAVHNIIGVADTSTDLNFQTGITRHLHFNSNESVLSHLTPTEPLIIAPVQTAQPPSAKRKRKTASQEKRGKRNKDSKIVTPVRRGDRRCKSKRTVKVKLEDDTESTTSE